MFLYFCANTVLLSLTQANPITLAIIHYAPNPRRVGNYCFITLYGLLHCGTEELRNLLKVTPDQ